MKTLLSIMGALALVVAGIYLLGYGPEYRQLAHAPWDVQVEGGRVRAFGVQLGEDILARAVDQLGEPEAVTVFVSADGRRSAEAFFGRVEARGITGRLIARLETPPARVLDGVRKKPATGGGWQYPIGDWHAGPLASAVVQGLSFLPDARGIDTGVLARRFGHEPEVYVTGESGRVVWFEPLRVRILETGRGRMVMEYGVDPQQALPVDLPQGRLDSPAENR